MTNPASAYRTNAPLTKPVTPLPEDKSRKEGPGYIRHQADVVGPNIVEPMVLQREQSDRAKLLEDGTVTINRADGSTQSTEIPRDGLSQTQDELYGPIQ